MALLVVVEAILGVEQAWTPNIYLNKYIYFISVNSLCIYSPERET